MSKKSIPEQFSFPPGSEISTQDGDRIRKPGESATSLPRLPVDKMAGVFLWLVSSLLLGLGLGEAQQTKTVNQKLNETEVNSNWTKLIETELNWLKLN